MSRMKEVAKLACGFEAFHSLAHGYFAVSGTTVTLLRFPPTPTMHVVSSVVNAVIAVVLGFYAWRPIARRG